MDIIAICAGIIIGWIVPQPKFAKAIQEKVIDIGLPKIMEMLKKLGLKISIEKEAASEEKKSEEKPN